MTRKRKIVLVAGIIFVFALAVILHKVVAGNSIENKTYSYLGDLGYTEIDIADVEKDHSFVRKILGYNEWRIFVEFKSEPDITFSFTYRD